jgi:hypothetical protein
VPAAAASLSQLRPHDYPLPCVRLLAPSTILSALGWDIPPVTLTLCFFVQNSPSSLSRLPPLQLTHHARFPPLRRGSAKLAPLLLHLARDSSDFALCASTSALHSRSHPRRAHHACSKCTAPQDNHQTDGRGPPLDARGIGGPDCGHDLQQAEHAHENIDRGRHCSTWRLAHVPWKRRHTAGCTIISSIPTISADVKEIRSTNPSTTPPSSSLA